MIVIISKRSLELSTERVMDWLYYYGYEALRINGDDIIDSRDLYQAITHDNQKLFIGKDKFLEVEDVSVVWFRRWSDRGFLENFNVNESFQLGIPFQLMENINTDYSCFRAFLFSRFSGKPFISNPRNLNGLNKFVVLNIAQRLGLTVPETIVCHNKQSLLAFLQQKKKVITKDVENSIFVKIGSFHYSTFTTQLDESNIDKIPDYFSLSTFQELVEKQYEIRIFFFFGKFYSMAIFSQQDEKTSVDFRRYNMQNPNRNVPYKLPTEIESKLLQLMEKCQLETASIDMIRSKQGEYIFLEINPVGQFSMVSRPCNYYLESIIAQKLIDYEQQRKFSEGIPGINGQLSAAPGVPVSC